MVRKPFEAVRAQQEPQFQRAEAPAERHRPFGIVDDAVAAVRLQEFRLDGQRPHEAFRVAHELDRAVELRAQPFVRIEDDRIRLLDAGPVVPEFRADHRRAGPGGIDMHDRARAAWRPRRQRATSSVPPTLVPPTLAMMPAGSRPAALSRDDRGLECRRVHAAQRARAGQLDQIVLADAGHPDRPVDRRMHLVEQ